MFIYSILAKRIIGKERTLKPPHPSTQNTDSNIIINRKRKAGPWVPSFENRGGRWLEEVPVGVYTFSTTNVEVFSFSVSQHLWWDWREGPTRSQNQRKLLRYASLQ